MADFFFNEFAEDAFLFGAHILTEFDIVTVVLQDLDGLMVLESEGFIEELEVVEGMLGLDDVDFLGRAGLEALEDADEESVERSTASW